jgi:hypothetical protein
MKAGLYFDENLNQVQVDDKHHLLAYDANIYPKDGTMQNKVL